LDHGIIEVVAYQETLLVMAIFGIAVLAMIWVGFRRWLQHRDKIDRLIAAQTAERAAQYGDEMKRVEARLKALEQIVSGSAAPAGPQIGTPTSNALPEPTSKLGEA
jgi:hypothetical protein